MLKGQTKEVFVCPFLFDTAVFIYCFSISLLFLVRFLAGALIVQFFHRKVQYFYLMDYISSLC